MNRSVAIAITLLAAVALLATHALSRDGAQGPAPEGDDLAITISPATLNLAAPVDQITVHTNIPLKEVDTDTVELEGIGAASTFADSRGNLVVKVDVEEVAELVAPPSATLTLTLTTVDGVPLEAGDTITVIDGPAGPNAPQD